MRFTEFGCKACEKRFTVRGAPEPGTNTIDECPNCGKDEGFLKGDTVSLPTPVVTIYDVTNR